MAELKRKVLLRKDRLLTIILFLTVFYVLWGFVHRTTIYGSKLVQYVHLMLIFILSAYYISKHNRGKITNTYVAWMPYLVYTLGYLTFTLLFQLSNFILFVEWYICLFMMLIAVRKPLQNYIPAKFILWSGFFAIIGIAFQAFLPSLYNSRISGIFVTEESILRWSENDYGLSGFTSQVAITARILIYAEIFLLYMKDAILPKPLQNKTSFYLLVVLFVFCVLLTGKRLHSIIALSLPFIVLFLSEKKTNKNSFKLFKIVLLLMVVGVVFVSKIDYFLQTDTFRRIAMTYTMAEQGEDITAGRIGLFIEAWRAFQNYPIFGIGLGNFGSYAGVEHYVHCTYLQVLCEQGIIGIILFVSALFMSIRNTIKLLKKDIYSLNFLKVSLGIQIFYAVYCLTGNELSGAGLIMYFLAIAILVSVEKFNVSYYRS